MTNMEEGRMLLINQIISAGPAESKRTLRSITVVRLFGVRAALRLPAAPSILGSERGVALVMALILGLVGMLMIGSLLYMAGTGIWTSGSKNRYQAALESAHGGLNFFAKEIIQRGVGGATLASMGTYGGILAALNPNFTTKLTTTGSLGVGGYPANNPDATLTFAAVAPSPNMVVNTAILSTSRGNSGVSTNVLMGGGVVNNNSGTTTPPHIPYLYQTGIQAQSVSAQENARLSSIYVY
jgi:hypothetical protein